MIRKIIAFQKMMFQVSFSQVFSNKKQSLKGKINTPEFIILLISLLIVYFIGLRLFSGLIGLMVVPLFMLPYLYKLICVNENIIFHLPLKRSFIILNIYIFATCVTLIISLVAGWIISLMALVIALISSITGDMRQLSISKFDIAMLQVFIFLILYVITFANGIITGLFTNRSRLRIAIIILFTAIYSSIALYIYSILPRDPKQISFNLVNSLVLTPNSWAYVAIAFCACLFITLGGICMSTRFDKGRRSLKNN